MKRIVTLIIFCLVTCSSNFAQSWLANLDLVRNIKLLESTRDDVIKILSNDIFPLSEAPARLPWETFYTENAVVRVFYSSGKCSEESEDWNVAEWKVTEIRISLKDSISIKELGIDYSKFRKEKPRKHYKELALYGDKKAGISILAYGDGVESVTFSPAVNRFNLLCDKPEVKKYYSSKRLIRNPEMRDATYHYYGSPSVTNLDLSRAETSCGGGEISVSTKIVNPISDPITYAYYISGGAIIGSGSKVIWNLSAVIPGVYKITAVADNGCGPCGKYITKTVVVKVCDELSKK